MVVSPCISICKTDPDTGYCYGCGRTDTEKIKWKSEDATEDWKKNVSDGGEAFGILLNSLNG